MFVCTFVCMYACLFFSFVVSLSFFVQILFCSDFFDMKFKCLFIFVLVCPLDSIISIYHFSLFLYELYFILLFVLLSFYHYLSSAKGIHQVLNHF